MYECVECIIKEITIIDAGFQVYDQDKSGLKFLKWLDQSAYDIGPKHQGISTIKI